MEVSGDEPSRDCIKFFIRFTDPVLSRAQPLNGLLKRQGMIKLLVFTNQSPGDFNAPGDDSFIG